MKKCIICEQQQAQGIHLYTSFICENCERAMVNTSTKDPAYRFYIKQLKAVKENKIYS